jgi:hypothetical protein
MNTYLPDLKVLWMAENVMAGLHNIYTLRGAPVRNALNWSKYINDALYRFGGEAEVMFASHHWPRWGNERIQEILRAQRDMYANLNNQVLHLANQGVTINQIHNVYEEPKSLQQNWYNRGYHGSYKHNSRGVIQRFLGFWDCNPTTLIPLSPDESAPLYVEMMGGAEKIMARGSQLINEGKYFHATEILDKLVQAEPGNRMAKDLLADAFEQIGYQQENPGLRNSFLSGAYELRNDIPTSATPNTASPDTIRAMSTGQFLDFLGIRMDSRRAEDLNFTMNLVTPDNGEQFAIELANATLTNIQGFQVANPDFSMTINRSDLEQVMMGAKTLEALIGDGTAKVSGDVSVLGKLASLMVEFDPLFILGSRDEPLRFQAPALTLSGDVTREQLQNRQELLSKLDVARRDFEAFPAERLWKQHQQRALNLLLSADATAAFDVSQEPAAIRSRYGDTINSTSLLLARRLVEAEVPFVTVFWQGDDSLRKKCKSAGSWDTHGNNFNCLQDDLLPEFDRAFSALVEDLAQSGLLEQTLLVVTSEMGRTPKIGDPRSGGPSGAGRDHWTHCQSVLMAGGGIRGGQVFGSSDRLGEYPDEHPLTPADIAKTVYAATQTEDLMAYDSEGRPYNLLEQGQPIHQLF